MTVVHDDKLFAELARLRTTLPADPTFLALLDARYGSSTSGAGAPAGTGSNGQWYYDTTNDRVYFSDGVGWIVMYEPEQTYVATWTNVTLGTGSTRVGTYQRSNGYYDFYLSVVLGTGGVLTGSPSVSVPIALGTFQRYSFAVTLKDASVNTYRGAHELGGGGATTITLYSVTGTPPLEAATVISATAPFTWTVSDSMIISGRAKMNTPYL